MRPVILLILLVLLAPAATAATVATPVIVRCNSFYCFSYLDEDGDGTTDGVLGGTASFLHEAPTVNFGWTTGGFFVAGEVLVGHEEDDPLAANPYVGGERDGTRVHVVYASFDLLQLDSEQGTGTPIVSASARVDDADGDGVPETVSYNVLP